MPKKINNDSLMLEETFQEMSQRKKTMREIESKIKKGTQKDGGEKKNDAEKNNYDMMKNEILTHIDTMCKDHLPKRIDEKGLHMIPTKISSYERIVVFGDIHGDLMLLNQLFAHSGVASFVCNENNGAVTEDQYKWIGGNTVLIQVGDQIDRCRPTKTNHCAGDKDDEGNDGLIMRIFDSLNRQAVVSGEGMVMSLMGNHEIMNSMGNMDYVSEKGFEEFGGMDERIKQFKPGGKYAVMMGCTRQSIVMVRSMVFVHGGLDKKYFEKNSITDEQDFDKINIIMKKWLFGIVDKNDSEANFLFENDSIFWSRKMGKLKSGKKNNKDSNDKDENNCYNISNFLNRIGVSHVIIGHTPQSFQNNEGINSTCDGMVWRIDCGSSKSFDKFDQFNKNTKKARKPQYLEIVFDKEGQKDIFNIVYCN